MNVCNATLTTATVYDKCQFGETLGCFHGNCLKVDGKWQHVELHTLTCDSAQAAACKGEHMQSTSDGGKWSDDTKGATPHTSVSTVTDAEVEAAIDVFVSNNQPVYLLREALEAAAAVREAGDA